MTQLQPLTDLQFLRVCNLLPHAPKRAYHVITNKTDHNLLLDTEIGLRPFFLTETEYEFIFYGLTLERERD